MEYLLGVYDKLYNTFVFIFIVYCAMLLWFLIGFGISCATRSVGDDPILYFCKRYFKWLLIILITLLGIWIFLPSPHSTYGTFIQKYDKCAQELHQLKLNKIEQDINNIRSSEEVLDLTEQEQ